MTVAHFPTPAGLPEGAFDPRSGSLVERVLFNHRGLVLLLCAALTLLLGWQATQVRLNASFEKMIPQDHPYIVNYLGYRSELAGLGNAVRIVLEARQGGIYDAGYMDALQRLNDEIFVLDGVDRAAMRSLWTPSTRWMGVTEDGLDGGPVIPDGYDGSAEKLAELQRNVERSGEIGQIVANDQRSSIVYVPLLATYPDGKPLDYSRLSAELETLRAKYGNDATAVHITGFAKVVGDLIDGLKQIVGFFALATLIATAMLYHFTRCWRSTALVVACSLVAVLWQLGLIALLRYELNPYSVLVPFLVFAIGMSHGAQKMNGIMQDIGRGAPRLVAARLTFRRLFLAGLTALLCDVVGFAVLMVIRIDVIWELALISSLGVAILIFTNLILLPILLSYVGVSASAAQRSLRSEAEGGGLSGLWRFLASFATRQRAIAAILVSLLLSGAGLLVARSLQVGDLQAGAPELRPNSRYNRDVAFATAHYGASSDVFAAMVKTPDGGCADYATLARVDALEWQLRQLPGVETTKSLALLERQGLMGFTEGSPKWYELVRNQDMINNVTANAPRGLYNEYCNLLTVYAYLTDHKAATLAQVAETVERFAAEHGTDEAQFLLAAGNAGIEAATNSVVKEANRTMLLLVYAAVIVLCLVTFRSWRAVLCAVIPLAMTSILCEALMVGLDIGVKVATLPVIALGVGIGVDYALYVMSMVLAGLREGQTLVQAYERALLFTGRIVLLTGVTLAIGVGTWALSPIKYQADMGILLAFMFLWNMLGALVLLPALAHFLVHGKVAARDPVRLPSERLREAA